jgi:hypothetical protein
VQYLSLARPLEPLREHCSALGPLSHRGPQCRIADLLDALTLAVRQRATGAGYCLNLVIGELRRHGVMLPSIAAARPCSDGGRAGLDGRNAGVFLSPLQTGHQLSFALESSFLVSGHSGGRFDKCARGTL